ncbi:MAG: glycosyltransferase family 2 protein [Planctomycetota bacterium]|jgi:glycosyltransferase involved in cell wall biosynthesis
MSGSRRYAIVTPCRDEEHHIGATIRTVMAQTVPPTRWVIVDDGSTDGTPGVLADAAERHPAIEIVTRGDRGGRAVGGGVVGAFYAGLEGLDLDEYDYIAKLDADLELPERYFEHVIEELEAEPRLGNMSGKVYLRLEDGTLVPERMGDENAIGAAKFYRVACFEQIGGFVKNAGWDGIDGHMCRMKGWVARSEDRPELRIIHRRLMGSSQVSVWHGRLRWGGGKWFMGSALYYVLAVSFYRIFERPFFIGGLAILFGYLGAMIRRAPRLETPGFRPFLRRFELVSLLRGKNGAIARYNRRILSDAAGPSDRA